MSLNISKKMQPCFFYVFICLLAACSSTSRTRLPQTIAEINGQKITSSNLTIQLLQAGIARIRSKTERIKLGQIVLDKMIEETLLLEAAQKNHVTIQENEIDHALHQNTLSYSNASFRESLHHNYLTPDQYRQQLKNSLLLEKYLQQVVAKAPLPTKQEVETKIAKEKNRLLPKRIHARQILLQTEEEARFVIAKLRKKEIDFEVAAKRYSIGPEGENGGYLGWFTQGQFPPIFDTCFDLKKMQVSGVISSGHGYHIFQVIDEEPARLETSIEKRKRLQEKLLNEREQKAIEELTLRLRKNGNVQVNKKAFVQLIDSITQKSEPK